MSEDDLTFNQAVKQRAIRLQALISTDVGEFGVPPDIALRFRNAKHRADGRLDRRTREGKDLTKWEREFCAQKLREWSEAAA